jgi:hypothetical protein
MPVAAEDLRSPRCLNAAHGELYNELVGYEDPEGFKAVNDVLSCDK